MGNRVCISLKSFLCILRVSCSLIIFDTSNVYAHLHECTVLVLVSSFMQSINEYLYIYIPFVFQISYDKTFEISSFHSDSAFMKFYIIWIMRTILLKMLNIVFALFLSENIASVIQSRYQLIETPCICTESKLR